MSGFQGSDGKRWGRPVAAVQGADGAVYVSDDLSDGLPARPADPTAVGSRRPGLPAMGTLEA